MNNSESKLRYYKWLAVSGDVYDYIQKDILVGSRDFLYQEPLNSIVHEIQAERRVKEPHD